MAEIISITLNTGEIRIYNFEKQGRELEAKDKPNATKASEMLYEEFQHLSRNIRPYAIEISICRGIIYG